MIRLAEERTGGAADVLQNTRMSERIKYNPRRSWPLYARYYATFETEHERGYNLYKRPDGRYNTAPLTALGVLDAIAWLHELYRDDRNYVLIDPVAERLRARHPRAASACEAFDSEPGGMARALAEQSRSSCDRGPSW